MIDIWEAVDTVVKNFDTGEEFLSFYYQMNGKDPKINLVSTLEALCETYKVMGEIIDYNLVSRSYDRFDFTVEGIVALSVVDKDGELNTDIFRWEDV
jgi:hypothetical protein